MQTNKMWQEEDILKLEADLDLFYYIFLDYKERVIYIEPDLEEEMMDYTKSNN
jgi:hypothetical protein